MWVAGVDGCRAGWIAVLMRVNDPQAHLCGIPPGEIPHGHGDGLGVRPRHHGHARDGSREGRPERAVKENPRPPGSQKLPPAEPRPRPGGEDEGMKLPRPSHQAAATAWTGTWLAGRPFAVWMTSAITPVAISQGEWPPTLRPIGALRRASW